MAISDVARRIPRTQQPQIAVGIDRNNPLTRGLSLLVVGTGFQDAVTQSFATKNGISAVAAGIKGRAFTASSNSSVGASWPIPLVTSDGTYTGDYTIAVLANPIASGTREMLWSSTNGTQESYLVANANVALTATSGSISLSANFGGANGVEVAGAVDGKYNVYIASREGTTARMRVNNTETTNTCQTLLIGSATSKQNIAGYTGAGWGISAQVVICATWNRALSLVERTVFAANPWQLFEPQSRRIWVPVASGLPILSASTYTPGSLSSGGWRPRITAT